MRNSPRRDRRGLSVVLVGRGGVEPPTYHFSGDRSYQLSYLPERGPPYRSRVGGHESHPLPERVVHPEGAG